MTDLVARPASRGRAVAFLLLLTTMLFTGLSVTTQTQAYALVEEVKPVFLPGSLAAAAAVANGAGTVVVGSAALAGAGVVAVASAGLAIGYGAGLAGTKAVKMLWGWAAGTSTTYADPPATPGGIQAGTLYCMETAVFRVTAADGGTRGTCNANENTVGTFVNVSAASVEVVLCRYTNAGVLEAAKGGPLTLPPGGAVSQDQLVNRSATTIIAGTACPAAASNTQAGRFRGTAPAPVSPSPGSTAVTTTPTSTCSNGATVTGPPITYKRSDASLPPLIAPACPAGTSRTGFTAPSTAGSASVAAPVSPWSAPVIPSAFGECNPAGTCQLVLTRVAPGGGTLTCNGMTECTGWATQPELAPKRTVWDVATGTQVQVLVPTEPDGSTYRCQWGPYELKASECSTVPTEPAGGPGTGTGTGTGGAAVDGCDWQLKKPWTWPLTALICAFVPRQSVVDAAAAEISHAWDGTAPAVVTSAVDGVFAPVVALKDNTGPSNCQGPEFVVPQLPAMNSPMTLHPMSTCNELTTYLLGIYLPLASAFVYLGGFFAGTRLILKAFNVDTPVQT